MAHLALVIGNGFDIDVGVPSKYSDFVDSLEWDNLCKRFRGLMSSSPNYKENSLIAHLQKVYGEKNWFDIEEEIYNFVKKSIGDFHKQSYIITPFENESKRFEELGFKSIITDGTYFIEEVKKRAIKEKNLLPDKIYDEVEWLLNLLHIEHNKICENINIKEYPHIIYTLAYQDGMIDGLERALNYKSSGEYSHPCYLDRISDMYSKMMDENIKNNGKLEDICYLDGYNLSLLFLVLDKDDRPEIYPPLYSVFGTKNIKNMDDLKKALTIFPSKFKNEYKYAQKLVSGFKDNEIYHHKPFFIQ